MIIELQKRKELNALENKIAILNIASFLNNDEFNKLAMELEAHTLCEVMIKTDCGEFTLEVSDIDLGDF